LGIEVILVFERRIWKFVKVASLKFTWEFRITETYLCLQDEYLKQSIL
jgi:hypothetical protein